MCDHIIIQIETKIKIVEEKQNQFISWTSIDADMFNKSRDMILTDVNTDEIYVIIINICLDICKN